MTLFANKSGRRRLIWHKLVKITILIVPIATVANILAYVLVAQRWNPLALWLGFGAGISTVLVILLANAMTPVNRLPHIR